jgi:hypothetical protein
MKRQEYQLGPWVLFENLSDESERIIQVEHLQV